MKSAVAMIFYSGYSWYSRHSWLQNENKQSVPSLLLQALPYVSVRLGSYEAVFFIFLKNNNIQRLSLLLETLFEVRHTSRESCGGLSRSICLLWPVVLVGNWDVHVCLAVWFSSYLCLKPVKESPGSARREPAMQNVSIVVYEEVDTMEIEWLGSM